MSKCCTNNKYRQIQAIKNITLHDFNVFQENRARYTLFFWMCLESFGVCVCVWKKQSQKRPKTTLIGLPFLNFEIENILT